jgi:hypothetical protein
MAKREIVWTKTADIQFSGILEYWLRRNKSNSYPKRLIKLVSEITEQIAITPSMFKSANFADTRVAPLGHFSLFYKVTENKIIVTAFWDSRQNPEDLLNILTDNN